MTAHPDQVEVEIKAWVDDLADVRARLLAMGAQKTRTTHQRDHYLAHPSRSFEDTDEALRVRVEDERALLTYKGPKLDEETKSRREFETEVEDPRTALAIFESVGFDPVPRVEKKREMFVIDDLVVTLDTVETVGTFVEVEHRSPNEDLEESRARVLDFASDLGLDQLERRSYLELLLEEEDPGKRG